MGTVACLMRADGRTVAVRHQPLRGTLTLGSDVLARLVQIGSAAAAFAAGGMGFVLMQAVALRVMARPEVGRLVIAYGVVSVGQAFTGLGISQTLVRTAANDPRQLGWRVAVWRFTLQTAVPLSLAGAAVGILLPSLRPWGVAGAVILAAGMVSQTLLAVESSFRRIKSQFVTGALLTQITPLIVAAALAVCLAASKSVGAMTTLSVLVVVQIGLFLASAGAGTRGSTSLSRSTFQEWLPGSRRLIVAFWLSSFLAISYRWLDRFVVGAVLPLRDLTDYQSIVLLTTVFDLLGVSIGYINLPRYASAGRWHRQNLGLLAALVLCGVVLVALVSLTLARPLFLLSWTPVRIGTLVALTAVGILRLSYAEASAVVGALADPGSIVRFSAWMSVLLIVGAALVALLANEFGILGAAIGTAIVWATRAGVAVRFARG